MERISSKNVFLFDLDGTLYLGDRILPGAVELLQRLRKQKKKIFFFTNNSSRSDLDYQIKLEGMDFEADCSEIVMSTHTLISFLKKKKWQRVYLLGTPSMAQMLQKSGIQVSEFKPEAVVVGFDKTLTYERLKVATRLVASGLPFIVTHPDVFCPTDLGPEPDCGAIAAAIQAATARSPLVVLGKPHISMMIEVTKRLRCRKKDMVLIGDRLATDIEMGKNFGIDTLLVLSGEARRRDLQKKLKCKPTWVANSVEDLLQYF